MAPHQLALAPDQFWSTVAHAPIDWFVAGLIGWLAGGVVAEILRRTLTPKDCVVFVCTVAVLLWLGHYLQLAAGAGHGRPRNWPQLVVIAAVALPVGTAFWWLVGSIRSHGDERR